MIAILAAVFLFAAAVHPSGVPAECGSPSGASGRDPAAVILREDIFTKAPFASCHASTIVETPAGLLAAWFGGTGEGDPDVGIWLARRANGSWSVPEEIAVGRGADGKCLPCWNPVLFRSGRGTLFLFYKVGPGPASWWGLFSISADNGWTWSAAKRLPEGILGPIKNHPVEIEDGVILCGSSTEDKGWRVHFERTSDEGLTWTRTAAINDGRAFGLIQPALFPVHSTSGGASVIALMRSTVGRVYASRSADGGLGWSAPGPLDLPNPNSGLDGLTLRDGRFLLVYNPSGSDRSSLAIAVSHDGRAWRPVLDLESEAGAEFSYPAVTEGADGLVHITYTWKRLRIRHVIVDPSRL